MCAQQNVHVMEIEGDAVLALHKILETYNKEHPNEAIELFDFIIKIQSEPTLNKMMLIVGSKNISDHMVELFIKCGADVNKEYQNITVLTAAVYKDFPIEVMDIVIKAGADINKGKPGFSPLAVCMYKEKHYSIFEYLLQKGADVNCLGIDEVPLPIQAVLHKNKGIYLKKLFEHGADPFIIDQAGDDLIKLEHKNANRQVIIDMIYEYRKKFADKNNISIPIEHMFNFIRKQCRSFASNADHSQAI